VTWITAKPAMWGKSDPAYDERCGSAMSDDSTIPFDLPGTRTVLVVDDAGVVRRLAYRLLSEAGYRVFEAGSAIEAIEVLELAHGRLDAVLIDVVMPEVNGVDLARMIQERAPGIGIVFMSAYPAEVLVREGLHDLRVAFLGKPFTREDLFRVVDAAVRSSGARATGAGREVDRGSNN
jgi:two-component system cell cycle sensor histidine kinase/response regulator CckA